MTSELDALVWARHQAKEANFKGLCEAFDAMIRKHTKSLSPAPTITDEKREDDSGTVCPPRMSQEGNATAIPEKADLPGEVDLETNHLHLLADDHEVN